MLDEKNLNEVPSQTPVEEVKEGNAEETNVETKVESKVETNVETEVTSAKADKSKASAEKRAEKKAAKKKSLEEKAEARKAKKNEKVNLTFEEKAKIREEKRLAAERQTAKAVARYIRMSPMKVNIVLDLIRGKNVEEAMAILKFTPKDAAVVVAKVLKSAAANAVNNFDMNEDALYVTECHVGAGPIIKRFQPHAQGRAFSIMKRTSHVTVVVAERQ